MASLGRLSTRAQWRGSRRTRARGRAVGRVPPHARHVLQRPRPAARQEGEWTCPSSSRLPRRSFCCLVRGGANSVTRARAGGRAASRWGAWPAWSGGPQPSSSPGPAGAGPPTSKEPIHPLNTEAQRELTPYHFRRCPGARAQRLSYNQVASVHFITEGCGV